MTLAAIRLTLVALVDALLSAFQTRRGLSTRNLGEDLTFNHHIKKWRERPLLTDPRGRHAPPPLPPFGPPSDV